MNIPENVRTFLNNITDLSIGYNQVHFLKESTIEAGQTGFSRDEAGKSLVTGEEGAWQAGWLVIANDRLGDPIFIDINSADETVMIAAGGDETDEDWDPIFIADNLAAFGEIIKALQVLAQDRNDPVAIKTKPLTPQEKQQFINMVTKQNPGSDTWFWEDFLEL